MREDVFIKVRFKTTAEGGRKTSLKQKASIGVNFYACPMIVDGKAYDCRLLIRNKEIELGKHYEIPVIFLNKSEVLPHLFVGKNISL